MLHRKTITSAWGMLVFVLLASSCATSQALVALQERQKEFDLNNEAWFAARQKLKTMCPTPPAPLIPYLMKFQVDEHGMEKFRDYFSLRNDIREEMRKTGRGLLEVVASWKDDAQKDRPSKTLVEMNEGCDLRWVKLTNGPALDDWGFDWLPPNVVIIATHEEEVRRRHQPRFYDEYIYALGRYLSEQADQGRITEEQKMAAFNEGWKWMFQHVEKEVILLQRNVEMARQLDAARMQTLNSLAQAFASAAVIGLAAGATSTPSRVIPQPAIPTLQRQNLNCNVAPG